MMIKTKCCRACGAVKPLTDFYSNGAEGHFPSCRPCYMAARREAYRRNPDQAKAQVRRYRAKLKAQRLAETPSAPKSHGAPR